MDDIEVKIEDSNKMLESKSPSGSTKTMACVQRSVLEHGRPEPSPSCLWAGACSDQEVAVGRVRESDQPIVAMILIDSDREAHYVSVRT